MTPLESAAPWQPTVSQTRRRSALRIAGVTAVLLLVGAYLAGYVFLWSFGFNPREVISSASKVRPWADENVVVSSAAW